MLKRQCLRAPIFAAVVYLCAHPVDAQETTESVLKGAFVYNFARFTEWPPSALVAGMPLLTCVVGDEAVADALVANTDGREIDGHPMEVAVRPADALQGCHVLYVSSGSRSVVDAALAATEGSPVLTISDVQGFARTGGVAELFVEAGKMRFRVNQDSAMRSQIALSSRLLSLAELIDDSDR